MPISFQCDQCEKSYVVSDGLAGKKAACKQCGNRMTIPGSAAPSSVPAAAPARPASSRPAPPRSVTSTPAAVPVSRPKPVPTSSEPAFDDIYGLNEAPSALPVMPRIGGGDSDPDDDAPVKKKKKKKGFFASSGAKKASASAGGVIGGARVVWLVLVVIGAIFGGIRGLGLSSKSEVMKFNERQLAQVSELTASLKKVNDVNSASSMSASCNQILNSMITDLETNGRKKARMKDIEAVERELMPKVQSAKMQFEAEIRRLINIPGVIPALNIAPALQRLESVTNALVAENAQLRH